MEMADDAALNSQELAGIARARAAFCTFLSIHFTTLPDAAFVERMHDGAVTLMLEALVNDAAADADIATGASLMQAYLNQKRGEDLPQVAESLGVDRTRLYRGISPTYGPPPPYEMVWSKTWQDVGLLETLAGIYREAGLAPSPEVRERLDYVGVELDFMRELALREAVAWESNAPTTAAKLLETQHAFMAEHLGEWSPLFVEKALEWVETDFYKGHLLMLRGFITSEQQELASLVKETRAYGM